MARRLTDRQIVARYFGKSLTKPVGSYTDAYVHRLARSAQAQVKAGQTPTRQAARGHRRRLVGDSITAREHPPQFVVREVEGQRRRQSIRGVKPTALGVIIQREYRDQDAALRWLQRLPSEVGVQVVGHGELRPEYGEDEAQREHRPAATAEDEGDPDDEPEEPERTGILAWRSVYTGNAAGDPDENGIAMRDEADMTAALDRVFIPGSVDTIIVRWQR